MSFDRRGTPAVPALVREFLPLNRRRHAGLPSLSADEAARWHELRLLLERSMGVVPPPEAEARRRALRLPVHFPVRFEAGHAAGRGTVVDLSEGGLRLETPVALVPRAPIELGIDVAGGAGSGTIELTGVVCWARPDPPTSHTVAGVRFENLGPARAQALAGLVEELLARL